MAGIQEDISLRIKNNLNREAKFSILGGTQDPSNGQANAKTIYEWDLSSETFTNITTVQIEVKTINDNDFKTYEVTNQDGVISNIQTIVKLLNTLNLGVFNYTASTLWIINDINVYGDLQTKLSSGFDINAFVESAYNYFDSENKTTLSSFSSLYKPLIEEAIETIQNFVEYVETDGWELVYLTNASSVQISNTQNYHFSVVTNNGGVFNTNFFTGANSVTSTATDGMLIFNRDVEGYFGVQTLVANENGTALIYKNNFKGETRFAESSTEQRGWVALDNSYFQLNTEQPKQTIIYLDTQQNLDLYGNSFPSINIDGNQSLIFRVPPNASQQFIELGNQTGDAEINFGNFGNFSDFELDKTSSQNNVFNLNFSTLSPSVNDLILNNLSITFSGITNTINTVNIDSSFNTRFDYNTVALGNSFILNGLSSTSQANLVFEDDTTPLVLRFVNINLRFTYSTNLPPINILGIEQIPSTIALSLNLRDQKNPSNISMQYFNDWLYKLGTQDIIYNTQINIGNIVYYLDNNSFLLSGEGIVGVTSILQKNNASISLPVGAYTTNYGSLIISQKNNTTAKIFTDGTSSQVPFQVKYSEKGNIDVVEDSNFIFGNRQEIDLANKFTNANGNLIFTDEPDSAPLLNFGITSLGQFDSYEGLLFGNGSFSVQGLVNSLIVEGLSLNLTQGQDNEYNTIGLFKRDFSGFINFDNIFIRYFKITTTDISKQANFGGTGSYSDLPANGSFAIFNFLPSFNSTYFNLEDSEIGTDGGINTTDNSTRKLLPVLFDDNVQFLSGMIISATNFNFGVNSVSGNVELEFDISTNSGRPALVGLCTFIFVNFSSVSNDRVVMLLDSSFDGTGETLTSLEFENTDISEVIYQGTTTSTPNPTSIVLNTNLLEVFDFQNHNINSIIIEPTMNLLTNINVSANSLDSSGLDNLLIEVEALANSNGTLNYENQTTGASPNASFSGSAYNELINRGWTILGNAPV